MAELEKTVPVLKCQHLGIFGHWEFSLTRVLEKLFKREPKAEVKEGV